jgi:hypothetical protein
MKNAGIQVDVGLLEREARSLNKRFFTFHEKGRPYVILKWAQTQDGFIDRSDTLYADGSMIDGTTKLIGRVSFGLAAIGPQGQVNALAYGVPPCWNESAPGAEARAIYEALRMSILMLPSGRTGKVQSTG